MRSSLLPIWSGSSISWPIWIFLLQSKNPQKIIQKQPIMNFLLPGATIICMEFPVICSVVCKVHWFFHAILIIYPHFFILILSNLVFFFISFSFFLIFFCSFFQCISLFLILKLSFLLHFLFSYFVYAYLFFLPENN